MSRKKARKVYQVAITPTHNIVLKIFVIARHPKGAVSVAQAHGYTVSKSPGEKVDVVEVDQELAVKAINWEQSR